MLKINFKKNRRSRTTLYLIVISLLLIQFYNLASPGIAADPVRTDTSVQVANDMINNSTVYPDLLVLDVRTVEEFNTNHLHNATLIPLAELAGRLAELASYNDTEIIVYCQSGSRSLQASDILVANNFTKIFNMLGGINTWINAGYDYWLNENAPSIDIVVIVVVFVSIIGIVAVLVLFYSRRLKVRKRD